MRIIGHEFIKLFSHKILWGVIGGLLLINLFLFYHDLTVPDEYGCRAVDEAAVFSQLSAYPEEEWEDRLFERINFIYEAMMAGQESDTQYSAASLGEYILLQSVLAQIQSCNSYTGYLNGVLDSASNLSASSLWGGPETFAYRNAQKTIQAYKHLLGLQVRPDISGGVLRVLSYPMTDTFLLLSIGAILLQVLIDERSSGIFTLLKTTKHGRAALLASKAIVVAIVLLVLTTVFFLGNLILAQRIIGLGDLQRPIQSVQDFLASPYRMTVGNALLFFFIFKYLGMLLVAAVLFSICVFCRSRVTACLSIVFSLCASQTFYSGVSPYSYLAFLRPWMFTAILDTQSGLAKFRTVNYFQWPVDFNAATLIASIILSVGCLALAFWRFSGESITAGCISQYILRPRIRRHTAGLHTNLTRHEVHKLLIGQRGAWVILAFVLVQFCIYAPENLTASEEERFYAQYAAVLEGPLSLEKEMFLQRENTEFQSAEQKIGEYAQRAASGEISQETADYFIMKLTIPEEQRRAFQRAVDQYASLQLENEDGIYVEFLSQTLWNRLLGSEGIIADLADAGKLIVALAVFFSTIVSFECTTHVELLIDSSPRGMKAVNRRKAALSAGFSILFAALAFAPRTIMLFHAFPPRFGSMSCHSVLLWQDLPPGLSVTGALLLMWIERLLGAALASQFVVFLAQRFRQSTPTLFASLAALLIPELTAILGLTTEHLLVPVITGHLYLLSVSMHCLYLLFSLICLSWLNWLICRTETKTGQQSVFPHAINFCKR